MYIIEQDIPKVDEPKAEKAPDVWPLPQKEPEESKQEELDLKVQQMMDQFQDKKYKAEYLQLQQSFISDLRILSEGLKAIEPNKRHDHLILELTKINSWIESHIQS